MLVERAGCLHSIWREFAHEASTTDFDNTSQSLHAWPRIMLQPIAHMGAWASLSPMTQTDVLTNFSRLGGGVVRGHRDRSVSCSRAKCGRCFEPMQTAAATDAGHAAAADVSAWIHLRAPSAWSLYCTFLVRQEWLRPQLSHGKLGRCEHAYVRIDAPCFSLCWLCYGSVSASNQDCTGASAGAPLVVFALAHWRRV